MNIVFELQNNSLQEIKTIKEIFPESEITECRSLSGSELIQIFIPATSAVLVALASSSVIKAWIESKIIIVKIHGIEYEGRPENLPEEVKKAIQEEIKHDNKDDTR
ncbi:hypothetical protein IMSAGC019_03962 [Lachnospiraceae bacterium]|nr:hypothetical protein IMSAGC019_03962 [Lachnospiraceae bacterium]